MGRAIKSSTGGAGEELWPQRAAGAIETGADAGSAGRAGGAEHPHGAEDRSGRREPPADDGAAVAVSPQMSVGEFAGQMS
jgi:hypothetical protein